MFIYVHLIIIYLTFIQWAMATFSWSLQQAWRTLDQWQVVLLLSFFSRNKFQIDFLSHFITADRLAHLVEYRVQTTAGPTLKVFK